MNKPKPPKEDPAITAARVSAQNQAEAFQTKATQAQLSSDTLSLRRRFGSLGGISSSIVPTAFNGAGGGVPIASGVGGGGVPSGFTLGPQTGRPLGPILPVVY